MRSRNGYLTASHSQTDRLRADCLRPPVNLLDVLTDKTVRYRCIIESVSQGRVRQSLLCMRFVTPASICKSESTGLLSS
jgi:hypothetical protein